MATIGQLVRRIKDPIARQMSEAGEALSDIFARMGVKSADDIALLRRIDRQNGGTGNARPDIGPTGNQYSVAHQMQLPRGEWGTSRPRHFQLANENLYNDMLADPDYMDAIESMQPGTFGNVSPGAQGAFPRTSPDGWTWQHALTSQADGEGGVMQLVPRWQHEPGSIFQDVLHPRIGPNGGPMGGYAEWAVPNGARR